MKLVALPEDKFEKEFEKLFLKLDLLYLKEDNGLYNNPLASSKLAYEALHRKFVYEIHCFKKALQDA